MKKYFIIIGICLVAIISKGQSLNYRTSSQTSFFINDSFALEKCTSSTFSVCGDGFEQSYRIIPVMLKYHKNSVDTFLNLYLDTVYMFYTDLVKKSFNLEYPQTFHTEITDTFANKKLGIITVKPNSSFGRKIRKYYLKNQIDPKKFEGFTYAIIPKTLFNCIYAGKIDLFIPDTNPSDKSLIKKIVTNLVLILPPAEN